MSDEVKLTWGKTENDLLQRWPKSADGTPEEPGHERRDGHALRHAPLV